LYIYKNTENMLTPTGWAKKRHPFQLRPYSAAQTAKRHTFMLFL